MTDEFDKQAREIAKSVIFDWENESNGPDDYEALGKDIASKVSAALRKLGQERDCYRQDKSELRDQIKQLRTTAKTVAEYIDKLIDSGCKLQAERDELRGGFDLAIQARDHLQMQCDELKARLDAIQDEFSFETSVGRVKCHDGTSVVFFNSWPEASEYVGKRIKVTIGKIKGTES